MTAHIFAPAQGFVGDASFFIGDCKISQFIVFDMDAVVLAGPFAGNSAGPEDPYPRSCSESDEISPVMLAI